MDLKKALIADAVVLVIYALAANPAISGVSIHEWLGLGALLVVIVHTAMHFDHIIETFRAPTNRRGIRLAKAVLDVALVLVFALCAVSGVMVSGTLLQTFGFYAEGYYFWDPLHAASAKILLAMLLVHVVANWKLIAAGLRKKSDQGE